MAMALLWGGWASLALTVRSTLSPLRLASIQVLNICSECALYAAAAYWTHEHQDVPGPLALGFVAAAGALLLSYARTRIRASAGQDLPDGPYGLAGREVRLLVLALGIATGQVYAALIVIAVLAHGATLLHLARLRATLTG